jgi:hypothetical protein
MGDVAFWHRPEIRAAAATESGIRGNLTRQIGIWEAAARRPDLTTAAIRRLGRRRALPRR